MNGPWLVPFFLGVMGVFQASVNRHIGTHVGFPVAVFLNALVVMVMACLFVVFGEKLPSWLGGTASWSAIRESMAWWWLLPGVCGFSFILGMAFSLTQLSASQVFTVLIVSQLLAGLAYDMIRQPGTVTPATVTGVILAMVGAFLVLRRSIT